MSRRRCRAGEWVGHVHRRQLVEHGEPRDLQRVVTVDLALHAPPPPALVVGGGGGGGADVSVANDEGMTPLHIAQCASAMKALIATGADANARAQGGMTPLIVQSTEGEDTGALETMEALLKAGADPNMKDDDGQTAMDYALPREEDKKVALLRKHDGTAAK